MKGGPIRNASSVGEVSRQQCITGPPAVFIFEVVHLFVFVFVFVFAPAAQDVFTRKGDVSRLA